MSPLSIEEETTTTLITTTTITTMHVPGIAQRKLCVRACVCVRAEWTHKVTIQPAAVERSQFSTASTSNFNRMTLRHNFCLCLKKNYGLMNKVTRHITWNINDQTASYNNQLYSMANTIYTFKVACFCITVVLQLIFFLTFQDSCFGGSGQKTQAAVRRHMHLELLGISMAIIGANMGHVDRTRRLSCSVVFTAD